ncbi:MAG: DUF669 domain-containing protein [Lachnospiraceae bacterium]
MVDFSKFDEKVDLDGLQKEVSEAKETTETPDGTYVVSIEKMEIKLTKAEDKLMFAVQCKIVEGDQKGRMIFFNRIISGNKSPKWTDGQAIKSVITWIGHLIEDDEIEFVNYQDFAEQVLDVFQEVQGAIEVEVDYVADAFNPITIKEVFEV